MSRKSELNELVREYQTDIAAGRKNTLLITKIVNITMELTKAQMNKKEYQNVLFYEVLLKAIKGYDASSGNDFIKYLRRSLTNEMRTVYRKENSDKTPVIGLWLDDDSIGAENFIESEQATKEMQRYEETTVLYDCILNVVRIIQKEKKRKKSKTRCWDTCFFTEQIAEKIKYDKNMYDHICSNSERYLSTISLDFINSYTTTTCNTIKDVRSAELKLAKDFGLKISGPCGYKLKNEVYASYFGVKTSAVSQNWKKYCSHLKEKLKGNLD